MPPSDHPQFHFALPRFAALLCGGNAARTEKNWREANTAGAAIMLISYVAIARFFLTGLVLWKQLALLLPVLFATWIFWLLLLFVNAQIIKLLRALKLVQGVSNTGAQSVLIFFVTTALAYPLLAAGLWMSVLSTIWFSAVVANLVAAALLASFYRPADAP